MECDDDGIEQVQTGGRRLKRKRRAGASRGVRLAFPGAVLCAVASRTLSLAVRAPSAAPASRHCYAPFMSTMDEISYWIHTKRAPCLFNYDNIIKKQSEQAQCSATRPPSIQSKEEDQSPKKKKLKLLDEDSVSTEKQQNVYFKTPQIKKQALVSSKSDGAGSDIEYKIKSSSTLKKSKNSKISPTRLPKKNKVPTSTPKVDKLRRSQRNAQQKWNNSHMNSSFEIFNASIINGKQETIGDEDKQQDRVSADNPKSKVMLPEKGMKNDVTHNGDFEDLSDVSGFTANYIRSTKIHSSKRPQRLKNQNSRTFPKQSKQKEKRNKMVMCVNKSVNTGFPDTAAMNCSTDSSQNALKLVTVKSNEQPSGANKSTSLLKFMETKLDEQESKGNLIISFQSHSSNTSRYPRRHQHKTPPANCSSANITISKTNTTGKKYNIRKGNFNINRKEHSEEKIVSKTRSGRRRGIKLDVETTPSVQQLNSSTERVSSSQALNVACPESTDMKQNNASSRCLRSRTLRNRVGIFYKESSSEISNEKLSDTTPCALQSTSKCVKKEKKALGKSGQSLSRDSLRDKSGFAACFSDSDSDSAPLKQRKFFC